MQIESQEPEMLRPLLIIGLDLLQAESTMPYCAASQGYWDQAAEDPIIKLELNYGKACQRLQINGDYNMIDFDGHSKKL